MHHGPRRKGPARLSLCLSLPLSRSYRHGGYEVCLSRAHRVPARAFLSRRDLSLALFRVSARTGVTAVLLEVRSHRIAPSSPRESSRTTYANDSIDIRRLTDARRIRRMIEAGNSATFAESGARMKVRTTFFRLTIHPGCFFSPPFAECPLSLPPSRRIPLVSRRSYYCI